MWKEVHSGSGYIYSGDLLDIYSGDLLDIYGGEDLLYIST
jgi:hypothetical protein